MSQEATGLALNVLNRFAGSNIADRLHLRKPAERMLYRATRSGFHTSGALNRRFKRLTQLNRPARLHTPGQTRGRFDLSITEEQQMIRDSVQRFAEEQLREHAAEADENAGPTPELLEQARALGLTDFAVPEALGGAAAEYSPVTSMLVAEDLAYGDMGLALAVMAPIGVAQALALWGSADQQARYLAAFADDPPPQAAIAVAEPRALFDPMQLETLAQRQGKAYVLSGRKSLVPLAEQCELFLVAAHVPGEGPAVFIVESSSDGVTLDNEPTMGLRAAGTGRLVLDNVRLAPSARLGEGEGFDYGHFLNLGTLLWCAMGVGTAQAVLDYVVPYVNERQAFGEPVSHRQSVAFMVANIGIEMEGMRLLTQRAASRAEQGLACRREVYLARTLCAERGMQIGSDGIQLLGGHGFTKEHPVERWYRHLRSLGVAEGGLHA